MKCKPSARIWSMCTRLCMHSTSCKHAYSRQPRVLHISSAFQVQQLCTAGIPYLQAQLLPIDSSLRTSLFEMRTKWPSHVIQFCMHARFCRVKMSMADLMYMQLYYNVLALQRSIFRDNCLNFLTFIHCCSFVVQIITRVVRCRVTDTHTHTDTQTKYSNPRCACTPRLNILQYLTHCHSIEMQSLYHYHILMCSFEFAHPKFKMHGTQNKSTEMQTLGDTYAYRAHVLDYTRMRLLCKLMCM